jgi:hypothetical protein
LIKKGRGTWRRALTENAALWGLGLALFLIIKLILGF